MEVTRRFWGLAGVGAVLAILAPLFSRPILLYGASGIGAVLVVSQYRFLRALQTTDAALTVDQSVTARYVKKGDQTLLTLAARLGRPSQLDVTIEPSLPLIAEKSDTTNGRLRLNAGDRSDETTVEVTWPVVGRARFEPPTVTAVDRSGLFREELPRGPTPTVVVEPRVPRNVHVGEGGEQVSASFGGHRSDQHGSGSDPVELRQYAPGDSVSDIDWKATARLAYPHVREYEVETDRQTMLVVDHRTRMATGSTGETKLDYLREVAMTFVESASDLTDPVGLATVGPGGLTAWEAPSTNKQTYGSIKTALHDLSVSDDGVDTNRTATALSVTGTSPGRARRKATMLAGDESAYGTHVRPFFSDAEGYVQRMDTDPLFGTIRTQLSQVAGSTWVAIFTDDTDRSQLRETVKLVANQAPAVRVFLTPTVLFERDGLADLESAYEDYVDFEEFRRELARLDGVTAFEVGPGDRVEAVLAAGRSRRR